MSIFDAIGSALSSAGSSILKGAGSALGSLLGQSAAPEPKLDLGRLRREAEANGFNPLTVLGATGGQGFQSAGSLSSSALLNATLGGALSGAASYDPAEEEYLRKSRELELQERRSNIARNSQMSTRSAPTPFDDFESYNTFFRGQYHTVNGIDGIRVRTPNGNDVMIPAQAAFRYGYSPGDVIDMGDVTNIIGEVQGIGTELDDIADTIWGNVTRLFSGSDGDVLPPEVPTPSAPLTTSPFLPSVTSPQVYDFNDARRRFGGTNW